MAIAPRPRADTPDADEPRAARAARAARGASSPPDALLADSPPKGARTWPPLGADGAFPGQHGNPVGAPLRTVCAGVGVAVHTLLSHHARAGATDIVWSERFFPPCGPESALVSFLWLTAGNPRLMPRPVLIEQYILMLASRLGALESDTVGAYIFFERLVRLHPSQLRIQTTRPLLLVCMIVAMKTNSDARIGARVALECVQDVLDAVSVEHVCAMERRLVALLDWRLWLEPSDYEMYRLALVDAAR